MVGKLDNIERTKENIFHQYREEEQLLRDQIQKPYKDVFSNLDFGYKASNISKRSIELKDKFNEKFKNNSDSIEYALFSNSQFQALMGDIMDIQSDNITEEKNKLNEYILEGKNRHELYNLGEIWNSDILSYDEYKEEYLSSENFEKFILSDRWIQIIINNFESHINPETGEVYQNFPIKKDVLICDLKSEWENFIFRNYYTGNPTYEIVEDYPNIIYNVIEDRFNSLIWDYVKNWGDKFDTDLINNLEWLINEIESSFSCPWDPEFEDIKDYIEEWRRDLFRIFLEKKINSFSGFVYKDGEISLETWDNQIDLHLKSYLYIYCKIFFPELLKSDNWNKWYDNELFELLKLILLDYNPELEAQIKNKELLEQKRKADQERRERELKRRQEAEKRNRERNNYLNKNTDSKPSFQDQDSSNAKNVSGKDLAKNVDLSDYSVKWDNMDSLSESAQVKDRALKLAWDEFIESNDEIKNIVTYPDILKLYNVDTNKIDEASRKTFLETDIMKWRSDEEISQIYKTLQSFSNNYHNAIKNISSKIIKGREKMDDKIKIYALWAVIDNVKNVFDSIISKWQWESKFEWFSFDSHEPVKRQWNDIIISWKFNWADIKIRYDLISGWLFMNSFVQHLSPSKVTIWNNTDANHKIGQLESFDTVLDEHYHSPKLQTNKSNLLNNWNREFISQNYWLSDWWEWDQDNITQWSDEPDIYDKRINKPSITISSQAEPAKEHASQLMMSKNEIESLKQRFGDMLNANIDLIGDAVVNHTKKQSARNSVIIKFMKTFNIILDEENMKNIDVSNESNMFDLIQIIENSDSTALETFQIFMEKIMEYVWLRRWNNNLQWYQKNQKSNSILDESNNNEYVSLLRDCSKDFSNNLDDLKWKLNFDSDSQLWFIDLISNNITNDVSKPNWKLDISKMNEFIYHLENDPQTVV